MFLESFHVGPYKLGGYGAERCSHLLDLADFYCVDWLKCDCEEVLERNATSENVLQLAPLAYFYNCQKLMKICQETVAMEPKLLGTAEWAGFHPDLTRQLSPREDNVEYHIGEMIDWDDIPDRHRYKVGKGRRSQAKDEEIDAETMRLGL